MVSGVFVVGAGEAKPSSEETSWARKLAEANAALDIEGPIVTMGLRKRWVQNLLKAAQPEVSDSDVGMLSVPVLVGALVVLALAAFVAFTASTPAPYDPEANSLVN